MTPQKRPDLDRRPDADKATDWDDSGEEGRSPEEQDRAAEGGPAPTPPSDRPGKS